MKQRTVRSHLFFLWPKLNSKPVHTCLYTRLSYIAHTSVSRERHARRTLVGPTGSVRGPYWQAVYLMSLNNEVPYCFPGSFFPKFKPCLLACLLDVIFINVFSLFLARSYSERAMAQTWWGSHPGNSEFHTNIRPSQPRHFHGIFHQGCSGAAGTSRTKRPRREHGTCRFPWHARMARSPWEVWSAWPAWSTWASGASGAPGVERRGRIRGPSRTGWNARISRISNVEDYHGHIHTFV